MARIVLFAMGLAVAPVMFGEGGSVQLVEGSATENSNIADEGRPNAASRERGIIPRSKFRHEAENAYL